MSPDHWRAVCGESRKHGSEGGGWKRTQSVTRPCLRTTGSRTPTQAVPRQPPTLRRDLRDRQDAAGRRVRRLRPEGPQRQAPPRREVTHPITHKLYFFPGRPSGSRRRRHAASAASSPPGSTCSGGRTSHGSCCNYRRGDGPPSRHPGPIWTGDSLGARLDLRSSPRHSSAWPDTARGWGRAAANAAPRRDVPGARRSLARDLVPARDHRPPAVRSSILRHGPQGPRSTVVPGRGG
jgi:hypothetical protein